MINSELNKKSIEYAKEEFPNDEFKQQIVINAYNKCAEEICNTILEMYSGNTDYYKNLTKCFEQIGLDVNSVLNKPGSLEHSSEGFGKLPINGDMRNDGTEVYYNGNWLKIGCTRCPFAAPYDSASKYCLCIKSKETSKHYCKLDDYTVDNCETLKATKKYRRMTNYELAHWLWEGSQKGEFREVISRSSEDGYIETNYGYWFSSEEVREDIKVRVNGGEWKEPIIEDK